MKGPDVLELLQYGIGVGRIGIVILAAIVSLVLSWVVFLYVRRVGGAIHPPGDNPCHAEGIRYGYGGLAVVLAGTLVSVLAMGIYSEWRPVLLFVFGLFLIGLLDDSHPLTPGWKIILQVPLVLMTALWLPRPVWVPYGLPWVLAVTAWLTVMTNAYNILDVVDGLLPSVASLHLSAVGLLLWMQGDTHLAMVALAFAGASLGFLPSNAWRGRQILGDSGSLPLGGLAALLILYVDIPSRGRQGWALAALLMAIPVLEVAWVSVRRVRSGIPPWRGSPHHFVYWLSGRLGSIPGSVVALAVVQSVPFILVVVSVKEPVDLVWPLAVIALLVGKPWVQKWTRT